MADNSAQITQERPSQEKPPARTPEKPRVFKTIQKTYQEARDRIKQAVTLPSGWTFDLTEFNEKITTLETRQRELDATTQAQLEQFTQNNPKDILDTSSVDKTKIREQLDEGEKVKKLRLQLGLPEVSPLLPTPESIAEKKRVIDEFVDKKNQAQLQDGRGFIDKDKGYIERSKSYERKLGVTDRIKRARMIKACQMEGIPNAAELVDATQLYYLDIKTARNIAGNIKGLSIAEIQQAKENMYAFGYNFGPGFLSSTEFIQAFKDFSKADATTIQKISEQLNKYTFLGKNNGQLLKVPHDGRISDEFAQIVQIVRNGGITPEQQKKLDEASRYALLTYWNVLTKNIDGTIRTSSHPTLAVVLNNGLPNDIVQDVLDYAENSVYLNILDSSTNPSIISSNVDHALQARDITTITQVGKLSRAGVDCRRFSVEKIAHVYDILNDAEKRDYALLFTELKGESKITSSDGDFMEGYYQNRDVLSQIATIIHALPESTHPRMQKILDNFVRENDKYALIIEEREIQNALYDASHDNEPKTPDEKKLLVVLNGFKTKGHYLTFDMDLLPLASYLSQNKNHISDFFDNEMKPTDTLINHITDQQTNYPKKLQQIFINNYPMNIQPEILAPHARLLNADNLTTFSFWLPETVLQDPNLHLTPDVVNLLSALKLAPLNVRDAIAKTCAQFEGTIPPLYQNGAVTEAFVEMALEKRSFGTFKTILETDLSANPNLSEKTRQYLNTINSASDQAIKEILYKTHENFDMYFQNGQVTSAFAEKIIAEKAFSGLSDYLTENVLASFDPQTQQILGYFKDLTPHLRTIAANKIPGFPRVPQEEFEKYKKTLKIATQIANSPSKEIQRLKQELVDQLIQSDNPEHLFAQVEDIFIKNNLPLVGKVYRVFEAIYDNGSNSRLDQMIDGSDRMSPKLKEASHQERRRTIYNDLLGVNIDSGNPSLRKFITILDDGEGLVQKAESEGIDSLSEQQRRQFDYFLDKMDTIYSTSLLGRRTSRNQPHDPSLHNQTPAERMQQIRTNFRMQEGQTIAHRLAEMFVKPLGYESTHQVREAMQQAKTSATERNKQFAKEMMAKHDGVVQVNAGDIFKGTDQMYLRNILENGSVAKEYLGSDSGSDMTPLDTDISMILEEDTQNGIRGALDVSQSKGYGNMTLIVRDRGQFNKDSNGRSYELFQIGVARERHYGIRTGFASTEISAIMDNGMSDRQRDNMYFTIARNGFYIPVTDAEGKITFTPEMYDEYRKIFDGVNEYDGAPLVVDKLPNGDIAPEVIEKTTASIQALVGTIKEEAVTVDESLDKIRAVIKEVLTANGVKLRDQYDTSIFGADFADTGSTGRHTNKPGDMDFDLSLLLDAKDVARMPEIAKELKEKLNAREDKSHEEAANEYTQIRAMGAQLEGSEPLDIDIGIGRRADAGIFASHDAINAKLNSIRETYGDETCYEVLANVVLAKQILKEGHAYKKLEDGGFGGIGTEDWILANHGNMLEAFKTFYDAAHKDSQVISLDDFRTRYRIFNAGTNIKFPDNAENFIFTLKPEGYERMVQTIGSYLQAA